MRKNRLAVTAFRVGFNKAGVRSIGVLLTVLAVFFLLVVVNPLRLPYVDAYCGPSEIYPGNYYCSSLPAIGVGFYVALGMYMLLALIFGLALTFTLLSVYRASAEFVRDLAAEKTLGLLDDEEGK